MKNVKTTEKNTRTNERPGREIKIDGKVFGNDKISFRIGTAENKNSPETVYLSTSFWVDIKEKNDSENFDHKISREYSKELKNIYSKELSSILENNTLFPFFKENIFIYDFPENLNYNDKRSFTLLELNLHTVNCNKEIIDKVPLKNKGDQTELYDELIKVAQKIASSDLLNNKRNFSIHKSKK